MGDDVPDLGLSRAAGLFVAPANARPEVRERADVVCAAAGGRGAVREACEALLRARGAWDELLREPEPRG
jgi:3-deoxy-D-manno-octulosonate 8-phosphate phosphatase (KDO 8-P phosphatase)